jgi:hypothetical protein
MQQRIYHITDPVKWLAMTWPVPANSLVFWSAGRAGGVLLFAGIHYIMAADGNYAFSLNWLQAGDLISVVTFSGMP